MAGKTKGQKKKRAKVQKLQKQELQRLANLAKATVEEVRNNNEPAPPKVNEDAQKDEQMLATVPESEPDISESPTGRLDIPGPELQNTPVPFDPNSIVANILKKKDEK